MILNWIIFLVTFDHFWSEQFLMQEADFIYRKWMVPKMIYIRQSK